MAAPGRSALEAIVSKGGSNEAVGEAVLAFALASNGEALKSALAYFEDSSLVTRKLPLVASLLESIVRIPTPAVRRDVADAAVRHLKTSEPHHEALGNLCEVLAGEALEAESWRDAAAWLGKIPLTKRSPAYQLKIYVQLTNLGLEINDLVTAESHLGRATSVHAAVADPRQQVEYHACWARVMDFKREFEKAYARFYQLTFRPEMSAEEVAGALESACVCAILAKAGPQRSRALATLYKDARVATVPGAQFLEKMFLRRIVSKDEERAFALGLKPHHLARTTDDNTVLERAVVEHNVYAASQIYDNISFGELGALLGISEDKAEKVAATMLARGSIAGQIDQLAGFVVFAEPEVLDSWNKCIESLCDDVSALVVPIGQKYPALFANASSA